MNEGRVRGPQVDAVPLLFSQLQLDGATPDSIAATYGLDPDMVERAFEAARREGFVRADGEVYSLTRSGRQAMMTRGAAAAAN